MSKPPTVSERKFEEFDLETDSCMYCNEKFRNHTVYERDEHESGCCWKYYVICVSCGKENSLAQISKDKSCTCK